jgi:DNA-binding GntR family transcriptional regulator
LTKGVEPYTVDNRQYAQQDSVGKVTFQPSENLPEQVTRDIRDRIISSELKPGERILEARLAREMGVSRSPVREALRILERQKLVELIPRKGARVTQISTSHIEWFYDIFEVLYGLVARKATENADASDQRDLSRALDKIEKAADDRDTEAYYSGIFEFAAAGLRASRNPLLETILLDLWPSNRRIQFASLSSRANDLENNVRFFQDMYRHMRNRETDRVEAVVKAYARNEKAFALRIAHGGRHESAP